MKVLLQFAALMFAYFVLRWGFDAPSWGALVGSWTFWVATRPKDWQ